MLNLMKMEFTRIFKSKYAYIIFFATILTFFVAVALVDYTSKNIDNLEQNIVQTSDDNTNGVKVDINKKQAEELTDSGEDFIISSFSQSTYLIFLIMFGTLFFSNPYAHGFIKNFLGMGKNKGTYVLASFVIGSLFVLFSFALGAGILTFSVPFINNGMLKISDYGRLVKILFVELASHISYLAVILLAATITRSTTKTLMFTFLYPTIFFNFLRGIGDKFLSMFIDLPDNFSVANFVNIGNIFSTNFSSSSSDLTRSLLVAIFIGAISLALSYVIINKKDL